MLRDGGSKETRDAHIKHNLESLICLDLKPKIFKLKQESKEIFDGEEERNNGSNRDGSGLC